MGVGVEKCTFPRCCIASTNTLNLTKCRFRKIKCGNLHHSFFSTFKVTSTIKVFWLSEKTMNVRLFALHAGL